MRKNLVLTGMMGVGKSTIGRTLAKKLSYKYIDVDEVIEKTERSSINEIFKNKSELYFRVIENKITLRELKKRNCVISLGGGSFLDKKVRNAVKNQAISFWLDIETNTLIKRLKKSKKRPLLYNKNLIETINKIYFERKKTYGKADFKIKCDNLNSEKISDKILKIYEDSKNKI